MHRNMSGYTLHCFANIHRDLIVMQLLKVDYFISQILYMINIDITVNKVVDAWVFTY